MDLQVLAVPGRMGRMRSYAETQFSMDNNNTMTPSPKRIIQNGKMPKTVNLTKRLKYLPIMCSLLDGELFFHIAYWLFPKTKSIRTNINR